MTAILLVISAALVAALERFPRLRFAPHPFFRPGFSGDLLWLALGWVALGLVGATAIFALSDRLAAVGLPRLAALDLPLWQSALLALVALDLGNYAAHWLLHRFDALFELHKVHHSSRRLDWLATFRSHLLEQVLRRAVAPVGLILMGVPIPAVIAAVAAFNTWAILNHANLAPDFRILEPLLITPRLHRLHHSPATAHQNLGTVFSVWDRLRGTLVREDLPSDALLGVPGEVDSYPQSFAGQLAEPLRRIARRRRPRTFAGELGGA